MPTARHHRYEPVSSLEVDTKRSNVSNSK